MTGNRAPATSEQRGNHPVSITFVSVELLPLASIHIGTPVNPNQLASRRCLPIGGIIDAESCQFLDKNDSGCARDSFHMARLPGKQSSHASNCAS